MTHSPKAYSALICILTAAANPTLAQTWDPVSSDGMNNTAMGTGALLNPDLDSDGGCHNTASGADTLSVDTSGSYNSATGFASLTSNLAGNNNTGLGAETLYSNTSGSNNTATGYQALYTNSTGTGNSATGYQALYSNNGSYNTANGYQALQTNTTGSYTTAVGAYVLGTNTTGGYDTAFGAYALPVNTSGTGNTAFGYAGLRSNTSGNNNIGFGYQSLYSNGTGSNNIAMGYQAAYYVSDGSNNIEIGSMGAAGDNNLIRIGAQGTQKETLIAGIYGTAVTGSAVYVTSSGELGVMGSSERFKTDIATMPDLWTNLSQLRPVTFHYKSDLKGVLQYGLIAEEVDKVYPELVIRDEAGKIQGLRYEELAPMLLNEVQHQKTQLAQQSTELHEMRQQFAELKQANEAMQAAMATLLAKGDRVAMR